MSNYKFKFKACNNHPSYIIWEDGSILSLKNKNPKFLKQSINIDGYRTMVLDSNYFYMVHHLVLTNFKEPCPEGFTASHVDGNPSNNHVSNLTWESMKDNINRKKLHGTNYTWNSKNKPRIFKKDLRKVVNLAT